MRTRLPAAAVLPCLAWAALLPGASRAAEGEPAGAEPAPAEPEWKRAAREKLKRKITFEFADMPLDQAVVFLREVAQVGTVLDPRVVGENPPRVTLTMKNVPMRLALDRITRLAGLTWEIKDGAIFITKAKPAPAEKPAPGDVL